MGESRESALMLLNKMPDIQPGSIANDVSNRVMMEKEIKWLFENTKDYGGIFFHDNKVTMISFGLNHGIHLSDLINKNGEPEFTYLIKGPGDGGIYYRFFVIYLKKGICLQYTPPILFPFINLNEYEIKSNASIDNISYVDPNIKDGV